MKIKLIINARLNKFDLEALIAQSSTLLFHHCECLHVYMSLCVCLSVTVCLRVENVCIYIKVHTGGIIGP